MALSYHSVIGAMSIAAVSMAMPFAASAQTDTTEESAPILLFSGFGSTSADDLPLEISDDSPVPPMEVRDLGRTEAAPEIEAVRTDRTIIQNTWSIGVFR